MPFYEYECQACKYYAEVMQKISDPPLGKCPSCGKKQLKKLVSAPVFRLKGYFRFHFQMQCVSSALLHQVLRAVLPTVRVPQHVELTVDIDPQDML